MRPVWLVSWWERSQISQYVCELMLFCNRRQNRLHIIRMMGEMVFPSCQTGPLRKRGSCRLNCRYVNFSHATTFSYTHWHRWTIIRNLGKRDSTVERYPKPQNITKAGSTHVQGERHGDGDGDTFEQWRSPSLSEWPGSRDRGQPGLFVHSVTGRDIHSSAESDPHRGRRQRRECVMAAFMEIN